MHSLTTNRRARIPLAVIGVLLLLLTVGVVGTMETREEPTPDLDASTAIDQTEAMTQTVLRDSAQRGAETAAAQPLTSAADNEWGAVLNGTASDTTIHPSYAPETLTEDTFLNYLRAMMYLEIQAGLKHAGLEKGRVTTEVALPPIENATTFRRAVNSLTIRETKPGLLDVSIPNVTITASHDGELIDRRTQTMNVSIATPVMQLHKRVSAYQDALNAGVMERGFAQRFNARIYALGWARGYAQNYRLPIVEVIANRHIEPSANSALYRTQQDIFGAADPQLQNAVRLGWVCMAMQDGAGMFNQYMDEQALSYRNVSFVGDNLTFNQSDGNSTTVGVPADVGSVQELCNHAEWILGDQVTGELPAPPGVTELLGQAPGMNDTETLSVGNDASVPLARLVERHSDTSFQRAIQRIFTIDAAVRTSGVADLPDDPSYSGECPNGSLSSWTTTAQNQLQVLVLDRKKLDSTGPAQNYYRYRFKLRATFQGQKRCVDDPPVTDSSEWQLSNTLTTVVTETEANPDANIDQINPDTATETKYERGGPPLPAFRNYDGAQRNVTRQLLGESDTSRESFADWVEKQNYDSLEDDASETFSTSGTVELDHDEYLETPLPGELAVDISEIQTEIANVSYTFNRTAYLKQGDESPFARLIDRVNETMREAYLEREVPYRSVGQKAIYEGRYAYWQSLVRRLELLRGAHSESIDALAGQLQEADATLADALTYLQQGISNTPPEPVPLASPPVTNSISYEVSGAPTYLVADTLTTDDVPAVGADTNFSALTMKNREYIDLPYDNVIDGIVQWLTNKLTGWIPGIDWGSPDPTITFRMAGDVLLAGELATATDDVSGRLSHNESYDAESLAANLDTFRQNTEAAIDQFETEMAVRLTATLYPDQADVVRCLAYSPGQGLCDPLLAETESVVVERIKLALTETRDATREALAAYDDTPVSPTARKAVAIGNGNASAFVRENVTDALSDEQFHPQQFAGNYSQQQWQQIVDSAAVPAYEQAASMRVEIGDDPEDAEWIDNSLQTALGNVSQELVANRLDRAGDVVQEEIEAIVDESIQDWAGTWSGTKKRPARIPAGLPLLPLPGYWYATVNAWDINVGGEYARFTATANMGTPEGTTTTTYVREHETVSHEIAGQTRRLGVVEPISFRGRSLLAVLTPPGVGVGDRDDLNPECSDTFPILGPVGEREPDCSGELFGIEWTERTQGEG